MSARTVSNCYFVSELLPTDSALAILSSAARTPLASFSASSFAQKCMKNSRGCSLSLWLWSAVTSIPFARKARLTGLTSVDARTKSQGGHRTIEIPAKPKSDRRNQGKGDERLWFRRRLGVIQLRKAPACSGRQRRVQRRHPTPTRHFAQALLIVRPSARCQ